MSVSNVTVGAGTSSVVGVPSLFPTSINTMLQQYLSGVYASVTGGTAFFENNDVVTSADLINSATGLGLQEITDTDSVGTQTAGTVSGSYTVKPLAQNVIVEVGGTLTLTGGSIAGSNVIFGSNSDVNYVDTNANGSIFAAGGTNTISLFSAGGGSDSVSIYSSGKDYVNLLGSGTGVFSAGSTVGGSPQGDDTINIGDANVTVNATGNATVFARWNSENSGGSLDYVNSSNVFQTIEIGQFGSVGAPNHVTAFGGAGGGYFVGGAAGYNSLVGGTGAVILVGGGNGDFLEANSNGANAGVGGASINALFAGSGSETMVATASTGSNLFQVGLNYPGAALPPPGSGVIEDSGTGAQYFFLGNSPGETIYGSTALNSNGQGQDIFNFVSDATAGGGVFDIYHFIKGDQLTFIDGADTALGTASVQSIVPDPFSSANAIVGLTDGTRITLYGVSASALQINTNGTNPQSVTFK